MNHSVDSYDRYKHVGMHELAHTIRNPIVFFGRGVDNADEEVTMMAIWVRHFPLRVGRGDRDGCHVCLAKITPPASQHPDPLIFLYFRHTKIVPFGRARSRDESTE